MIPSKFLSACLVSVFVGLMLPAISLADTASIDEVDSNALTQKINPYVDSLNRFSNRVYDSYNRYFSWVNKDIGPTGQEQNIYGLYTLNGAGDVVEKSYLASDLSPTLSALDAAGMQYALAIVELDAIINIANDYYDQESFLEDSMAKGKALHPSLVAAFEKTLTADQVLRENITMISNVITQRELTVLSEDESNYDLYLLKRFMFEAGA